MHHPELESFDVNLHRLLSKKLSIKNAIVTPTQVVPEPATGDGSLKADYRITGDDLTKLSWQQFEALCAELFDKVYNASWSALTNYGADFGADVVVQASDYAVLLQCKHTKNFPAHTYQGHQAIQQVAQARIMYEKELDVPVTQQIVVTNYNGLSVKTQTIAKNYQVSLIDYHELEHLLNTYEINIKNIYRRLSQKRFVVKA